MAAFKANGLVRDEMAAYLDFVAGLTQCTIPEMRQWSQKEIDYLEKALIPLFKEKVESMSPKTVLAKLRHGDEVERQKERYPLSNEQPQQAQTTHTPVTSGLPFDYQMQKLLSNPLDTIMRLQRENEAYKMVNEEIRKERDELEVKNEALQKYITNALNHLNPTVSNPVQPSDPKRHDWTAFSHNPKPPLIELP